MTVTANWSITNMTQSSVEGYRLNISWQCLAQSDGTSNTATQSGSLDVNSTPTELTYEKVDGVVVTQSNPDFVAYALLSDDTMLSWVYGSLIEGDETAEEAKSRVEAVLAASLV